MPICTAPSVPPVAVWQNRFRTVLVDDSTPALANFTQRFRPTDALPFTTTFRTASPQWMQQPVGMVDMVEIRSHFSTQPTCRNWMIGAGINLDCSALFNLGDHATCIRAIVGTGTVDFVVVITPHYVATDQSFLFRSRKCMVVDNRLPRQQMDETVAGEKIGIHHSVFN